MVYSRKASWSGQCERRWQNSQDRGDRRQHTRWQRRWLSAATAGLSTAGPEVREATGAETGEQVRQDPGTFTPLQWELEYCRIGSKREATGAETGEQVRWDPGTFIPLQWELEYCRTGSQREATGAETGEQVRQGPGTFTPLQWELALPQQICTALTSSVYKNLLKQLAKFRLLSPIPRNSDSLGSRWQPQICTF